MVTRDHDIREALADPRLGNAPSSRAMVHERNRSRFICADVAANILPFLDDPQHRIPRRLLSRAFGSVMQDAGPDIDRIASDRLAPLLARPRFDLIRDFARPVAIQTISAIMGLPASAASNLSEWAEDFFRLFAPIDRTETRERMDRSLTDFRAFLQEILDDRARDPGADLLSRLTGSRDEENRLSPAQLVDNCMLVFADALENVDAGLANVVLALHRHPAALRAVIREPSLVGRAVVEGLRYDTPAQTIARIAREAFVWHGQTIKAESVVVLALGSANRDDAVVADAESFSLERTIAPDHTFGRGRHSCIGAGLVRAELTAALGAIVRNARHLEVDDRALEWEPRPGHRWLTALPVSLKSR